MKMKKYIIWTSLVTVFTFGLSSCADFLDELPDNRTELNPDNVGKILVSAYPTTAICEIGEVSSDNTDAYPNNFSSDRLLEDLYKWESTAEQDQDSPAALWESCYIAISACNQALKAVEDAGNPVSLNAVKGEALVCRAYAHFLLANIFCKAYGTTAKTDLGIPYMKDIETTVSPNYERGTLEDVYKNIESDLLAGVELISDNVYSVPKYHFTKKAAYALAARFYLYYVQPDKSNYDNVIKYADKVLGNNPSTLVRDWASLGELDLDKDILPNSYVSADNNANLLLVSTNSYWGFNVDPYGRGERYAHGPLVAVETCRSNGPWGNYSPAKESNVYYMFPWSNSSSLPTKVMLRKVAEYQEVVDPVAGTINGHIINAAFTTDETLLCRAEAYIMKGAGFYPQAIADLNVWQSAYTRSTTLLTVDAINNYYGNMGYYKPLEPTVKKELHPDFSIADATQENLIHCVLHARRILTLHEGLRWFDIKRYGIVVYRRFISNSGTVSVTDELKADDPRRAIQIPSDVISAGMKPNPRN
ncbi:RagB/SusD family nutrient uptake outer membrane protein [Bacteroides sp.]|uniref:RagB/SusD family nutrient uptake outer membrane protein n=1 Tax=Bacteroides sp. TaxID=29523 RepID=UPI0025C114B4|nr:RagB/SusD family nutrient uptake outer membrane protein [Bacteroides sp.]